MPSGKPEDIAATSKAPSPTEDDGGSSHYRPVTCRLSRLRYELALPAFHVTEPDGGAIDLQRTFAPKPIGPMIAAKALFLVWTLATVVVDTLLYFEHPWFSLAYLTHWALIFAYFYQMASLTAIVRLCGPGSGHGHEEGSSKKICGFPKSKLFSVMFGSGSDTVKVKARSKDSAGGEDSTNWLIRSLWCLFSVASTLQVVVALSYWPLIAFGVVTAPISYNNVMTHGGVAVLVLVDGLVLNRTPLRVRQAAFPMTVGAAYALWTVVHWLSGIGNPEENYDSIYPTLDWERRWAFSLVQCALLIFVVVPGVFLSIRLMSLWSALLNFDGGLRRTVCELRRGTMETLHRRTPTPPPIDPDGHALPASTHSARRAAAQAQTAQTCSNNGGRWSDQGQGNTTV